MAIDTTFPAIPSITGIGPDTGVLGDGQTSATALTVTGNAEPGSTVTLYADGVVVGTATANAQGVFSIPTGTLTPGAHNFVTTATDASGNTSQPSAQAGMTIDTTAPSAPVINTLGTDTGAQGDGKTSDNTLTATGTAEPGSTVNIYDNGALVGTVVADETGKWSFTTPVLPDGSHNITADATDAAGNTSPASAPASMAVDSSTVAPTVSSLTPSQVTPGVVVITGTAEPFAKVDIFENGVLVGTGVANANGDYTINTVPLTDGIHTLTPVATDVAGNTATGSPSAVIINSALPAGPTITGLGVDTGVQGDKLTADNTLTVTGAASPGQTVNIVVDGVVVGTGTADASGNYSITTSPLSDGAHVINAVGSGPATQPSAPANMTIDTSAPTTPSITGLGTDTGVQGDGTTADDTITINGNGEPGSTVVIFDNGQPIGSVVVDANGNWTFTTPPLADGSHSFTSQATDAAGNTSPISGPAAFIVDTTPPAAPAIVSVGTDTGAQGDGITADNTLTVTGTAEPGSVVTLYDNGQPIGTAIADANGNYTITTNPLADGPHNLTSTATDASGNESPASAPATITIDTQGPSRPLISAVSQDTNVAGDRITSDNTLAVSGFAEPGSNVQLFVDGVAVGAPVTAAADGSYTFPATSALSDGSHTFTTVATDAAGNASQPSAPVSFSIDTIAPAAPVLNGFTPDTGIVGDGKTDSTTPSIVGTAEPGSTVKIYDGSTLLGTGVADASGNFSIPVGPLTTGVHNLTSTSSDTAGNTSGSSNTLPVEITATQGAIAAPAITSVGTDTGVAGDGITSDNTQTVNGTGVPGATIDIYVDGA
ncbi:MAG: Ig-like domain-containing protein, partial [Planctomycetota bacterium]